MGLSLHSGKKRPFAILEKDERFLQAFSAITAAPVDDFTSKVIEDYACALFGARKMVPINHYRFKVFERAYGPKDAAKPFKRVKGIDASGIPPCAAVLKQKNCQNKLCGKNVECCLYQQHTKAPTLWMGTGKQFLYYPVA